MLPYPATEHGPDSPTITYKSFPCVTLSLNASHKVVQFSPLPYVLDLCQLLTLIIATWIDPRVRSSNCCSPPCPYVSLEAFIERSALPKPLKAIQVTSERGVVGRGPSNSSLFLPLWTLNLGLRTKTAGLNPYLHQLTSVSAAQNCSTCLRTRTRTRLLDCCSTP